jgi:hypothetical protein
MTRTDPKSWKYVNLGETRGTTHHTLLNRRDDAIVAACPFQDVEAELSYLCKLTEVSFGPIALLFPHIHSLFAISLFPPFSFLSTTLSFSLSFLTYTF